MESKSEPQINTTSELTGTTRTRSSKANFAAEGVGFAKFDPFAYIVLRKNGTVLAASELKHPNSNIPPFLPNATDTKGLNFAYIVFEGFLTDGCGNKIEPVQIIVMRRMYKMNIGSQHTNLHVAAIEMYNIRNILEECFNIILKEKEYLFSGEGAFDTGVVTESVSILEGEELRGVKFNTRGRGSDKFRKEDGEKLKVFMPKDCIDFHDGHDDHLKKKISTPESRRLKKQAKLEKSSKLSSKEEDNSEDSSLSITPQSRNDTETKASLSTSPSVESLNLKLNSLSLNTNITSSSKGESNLDTTNSNNTIEEVNPEKSTVESKSSISSTSSLVLNSIYHHKNTELTNHSSGKNLDGPKGDF
ncbi:hypothetical protein [Legionella gresilensis]|uniref:hypothetical protein n=1 Tax=Legionella gresilensis TaxID=91823 RepID=UPI0010412563|nr:hypothetical protein [Legionella gresilensis]